jgi:hypothetical protein
VKGTNWNKPKVLMHRRESRSVSNIKLPVLVTLPALMCAVCMKQPELWGSTTCSTFSLQPLPEDKTDMVCPKGPLYSTGRLVGGQVPRKIMTFLSQDISAVKGKDQTSLWLILRCRQSTCWWTLKCGSLELLGIKLQTWAITRWIAKILGWFHL